MKLLNKLYYFPVSIYSTCWRHCQWLWPWLHGLPAEVCMCSPETITIVQNKPPILMKRSFPKNHSFSFMILFLADLCVHHLIFIHSCKQSDCGFEFHPKKQASTAVKFRGVGRGARRVRTNPLSN